MLRMLFGEEPRLWSGPEAAVVREMERFIGQCAEWQPRPQLAESYRTMLIQAEGLLRSLDELEQSRYAAKKFAGRIGHLRFDAFSSEERLCYNRHVYFDKNAYIRVFALLDKTGILLNRLLNLRTERFKPQFSYFTVLRNMREHRLHAELMQSLNALKERHQPAMYRLRDRRNLEVHTMNAELSDDLKQWQAGRGEPRQLENIGANMADLDEAWLMVVGSLKFIFAYGNEQIRSGAYASAAMAQERRGRTGGRR